MFSHSLSFSFSNIIFCYFVSLSLSLQLILCFYLREVPGERWWCSRKLGYCKHRYSSILHSSSSKGKLLIECETKSVPFIPSLILFIAVISLTKVCERSSGGKVGLLADSRDDLIIPACEYPREYHSWRLGKSQAMSNSLLEYLLTYRIVPDIAINL